MRRLLLIPVAIALAAVPFTAYASESAPELTVLTPGGVFLANIDDDAGRCQAPARAIATKAVAREDAEDERYNQIAEPTPAQREAHRHAQNLADRQLAACNDAADEIVDGARDEQDLARLRASWPGVPAGATAKLITTGNVRLFVKRQRWEVATTLTAAELRTGVDLGLEGRDVVRDRAVWDGSASVTLRVSAGKTISVRLREAPVHTQLNTARLDRVLASTADDANGKEWRAATAAVLPAGVPMSVLDTGNDDWMQDLFEPGYQVMAGHAMRVLIPSVNQAHRVAARVTYTELRGPDVGVVHIPTVPVDGIDDLNTYDSMGNLETEPDGRIVLGGTPSPEVVTFLRAQGALMSIVDTSWLEIGHVDEFIQFLPVAGGWKAIVADPTTGLALLGSVPAGTLLHGGLPELGDYSPRIDQRTAGEFRADEQFTDTNRQAAAKIDAAIAALGLPASRIVRIPTLFTARGFDWALAKTEIDEMPPGPDKDRELAGLAARRTASAETPNPINGLLAGDGRYVAPKPFGPLLGGRDIFASAITEAMRTIGYRVTFVDDLTSAHVSLGEIHCSTNTFREIP
ncbi:protein-arginine deiminase family protein [Actinoplanes sp. NPDC026619]|uniref:protein-arginine deiminase family protein n=1 Tax=Actinoplanes sp. NPDC026619 TaxID=3155798 RepID=UPI0033D99BF9